MRSCAERDRDPAGARRRSGGGRHASVAALRAAALAPVLALSASASADFIWNGGDATDLWAAGANWMGGVAPPLDLAGDNLVFGSTGGMAQSPDAGADDYLNIASLAFTGADAALTLIGTGRLSFENGATITNDSAFLQTIDIGVIGTGTALVIEASVGDLLFGGPIILGDSDGVELTVRGAADTTIDGKVRGSGGSLVKDGGGVLTLNGENTFDGGTDLRDGTLVLGDDDALGTGRVTVTGDASIESDDDDRIVGNAIGIQNTRTLKYEGANDLELSGAINGRGGIEVDATAVDDLLTLSGFNTYEGGTLLTNGTIGIGNNSALGTGTLTVDGTGQLRSTADSRGITNRIRLEAGATLTVVGGRNLNLAGKIVGSGALEYDAATARDILRLGGDNTFSGGTTLRKGTLILESNKALGTGTLTLAANGRIQSDDDRRVVRNAINVNGNTLIVEADNDLELRGVISGTGGLRLDDDATLTLTLTRNHTYTGDTDIEGGELLLKGSLAGDVNVSSGGVMSGSGTIAGDLINRGGGIVDPGTGVGTLVVGGNYDQRERSTLRVKLSAEDGRSDLLDVTGAATLARKSTVLASITSDGFISSGQTFTIIDADGGVTDDGARIRTDSATLTVRLVLDDGFMNGDDEYALVVDRADDAYSAAADAGNNRAIATSLDALVGNAEADPAGEAADLLAGLDAKNGNQYNRALLELSPQTHDTAPRVAFDGAQAFTNVQSDHLAAQRGGIASWNRFMRTGAVRPGSLAFAGHDQALLASALAEFQESPPPSARRSDYRLGAFAELEGVFARIDSTRNRTGFATDAYGAQLGVDYRLTQGLTAGLAFGYVTAETDLEDQLGRMDVETIRFGPYFSVTSGDWFLDGSVSGAMHAFDSERSISSLDRTALGSYDATEISAYLATGREYDLGRNVFVTPILSAQYSLVDVDAFDETGAGAANLAVQARETDSLRARLGVNVALHFDLGVKLLPGIYVGWERELLDVDDIQASFVAGGGPFTIDNGKRPEDSLVVGVSLPMLFEPGFSGFVRYERATSNEGDVGTLAGGLSFSF